MRYTPLAMAAFLSSAQAATKTIKVGWNSTSNTAAPVYEPNNIMAEVGDVLEFLFAGGSHNVAQSTFDKPCVRVAGTPRSKLFTVTNTTNLPTYTLTVADKNPMWFFCSVGDHCSKGMALAVNANACGNSTQTIDAYQAAAANFVNACPASPGTGGSGSGSDSSPSSGTGSGSSPSPSSGSGSGSSPSPGSGSGSGSSPSSGSDPDSGAGGDSGAPAGGSAGTPAGESPANNGTVPLISGASGLSGSASWFAMGTAVFALVEFGLV